MRVLGRRFGLAAALLLGGMFSAGAEVIRIDRAWFTPASNAAAAQLFSATIQEGGRFVAKINARGREGVQYRIELVLQPEEGGSPRKVHFSFTGSESG